MMKRLVADSRRDADTPGDKRARPDAAATIRRGLDETPARLSFIDRFNVRAAQYLTTKPPEAVQAIEEANERRKLKGEKAHKAQNVFALLDKMLKESTNGERRVEYTQSTGFRVYAGGASLQGLMRAIRHTLCADLMYDIDIVNAYPTLFVQLCERHGIATPCWTRYVDKRAECLEEVGGDRGSAKTIILSILFGRSISSAKYHCKTPAGKRLAEGLHAEAAAVYPELMAHYPALAEKGKKNALKKSSECPEKTFSEMGSCLRLVLEKAEFEVICACIVHMAEMGILDDGWLALIHDGFMVAIMALERVGIQIDDLLRNLEAEVLRKTGFKVHLVCKPMDEGIAVPDDWAPTEQDGILLEGGDLEAARIVMDKLGVGGDRPRIVYSDDCFYAKLEDGIWTNNKNEVDRFLYRQINNVPMLKTIGKGQTIVYSAEDSGVKHIRNAIKQCIPHTPNFYWHLIKQAAGKLCFRNGYWDYDRKAFVSGLHGVDTLVCIPWDYEEPDNTMRERMLEVEKRVLKAILGRDTGEVYRAWKHIHARALAGRKDKLSVTAIARRSAGKSKLEILLMTGCGPYVKVIQLDTLASDHTTGDGERDNVVFLQVELARIAVAQESQDEGSGRTNKARTLSGKKWKNFQSGADMTRARVIGQESRVVRISALLSVGANEMPLIQPNNAYEFNVLLRYPNTFVTAAEKSRRAFDGTLQLKDPSIDDFVEDPENGKALVHILIEAYRDAPFEFDDYPELKELRDNDLEMSEESRLAKYVHVTGVDSDMVLSGTLVSVLKDVGIRMSHNQLAGTLEPMMRSILKGAVPFAILRQRKEDGKRYFHGVRLVDPPQTADSGRAMGFAP